MDRRKAIVRATGEIVTLRYDKNIDEETIYTILEDAKRKFIPDELHIIDDNWEFIEKWYPGYTHCDNVAYSDDLQCCLDGEADEEKLERVKEMFGETPELWECEQIKIDAYLLSTAVENFRNYIYHRKHYIE